MFKIKHLSWLVWMCVFVIWNACPTKNLQDIIYVILGQKEKNRVSEWLLFDAKSAIFQLYHGENKLIFNEIMMRSALY